MNIIKTSVIFLKLFSLLTLLIALNLHLTNQMILMDWLFANIGYTPLSCSIIFDSQGMILSSVVLFISGNVINFAMTYMQKDPFIKRFILLVLLFILSMNLLIFLPNLIILMIGWDGLGLVSFLLVIYYSNPKSLSAGMITALTNRIGDALILLSIAWLLNNNHWTINFLWATPQHTPVMLSITLAACTKSAQVPFSSWLPAAMAAPTPVSALVHSSTLVTAGVFLIIRFYPFLATIPYFHFLLLSMACMTMMMAGMAATVEPDLKKIIALSTLSQLGVMMGSIGIGLPNIALFHLMTHALFKALLFICAGTIIHFNSHSQDLRTTGTMLKLPITSTCFFTANLALCGAPFLTAFYSKDIILEFTLQAPTNMMMIMLFFFATSFTAIYTTRFLISLIWSPANFAPLNSFNEDKMISELPLTLLTLFAICGGCLMNWVMIQPQTTDPLPLPLKMLTTLVSLGGSMIAMNLTLTNSSQQIANTKLSQFNMFMWYLTPLSTQNMLTPPLKSSKLLLHSVDQGWQEILGGQGTLTMFKPSSILLAPPQSTLITTQILLSALIILIILLWKIMS